MSNILILYKSKYGSTKKYVDMLEKEITCDIFKINDFHFEDIKKYDFILFAGGIYAGGISIMKYIQKNNNLLVNKKTAIFAVGASPYDEKAFETTKTQNLKNIPFEIPMFYGRGAYDESVMNFVDKSLCKLLKKSLSKKDPSTFEPWMEALFQADDKNSDWVDKSYLESLIKYIHKELGL